MRKSIAMLSALAVVAASSVAFAETDISKEKLVVEGIAFNTESAADGYSEAVMAAYNDGMNKVDDIRIDGKATVQSASSNSAVKAKVKSALKDAKIAKYFRDDQGAYHVVVEIPVYGSSGLMEVLVPQVKESKIPTLEALKLSNSADTYSAKGDYTGLVVDCKGLSVNTAVAPAIVSSSRKVVYGIENMNRDKVVAHGLVDYAGSLKDTDRAGKNPLVVKAVSVSEHNTRVAVSDLDLVKILSENAVSEFLSEGKVVFLK